MDSRIWTQHYYSFEASELFLLRNIFCESIDYVKKIEHETDIGVINEF